MPGSSGMETLKTEALKQGRWRLGEDGYIEKVRSRRKNQRQRLTVGYQSRYR